VPDLFGASRVHVASSALAALISTVCLLLTLAGCAPIAASPSPGLAGRTGSPGTSSVLSSSPGPSIGIFPGTADEYQAALVDCLRQAGWPVQVTADGGLKADFSAAQRSAFIAAEAACAASLGEPPTFPPVTEADMRARYQFLVHARGCLIALGYTVAEPPSVDEYVDTYWTKPWTPFSEVNAQTTSESEWNHVNEVCPQVPNP
jgi:hypothetical protein